MQDFVSMRNVYPGQEQHEYRTRFYGARLSSDLIIYLLVLLKETAIL